MVTITDVAGFRGLKPPKEKLTLPPKKQVKPKIHYGQQWILG